MVSSWTAGSSIFTNLLKRKPRPQEQEFFKLWGLTFERSQWYCRWNFVCMLFSLGLTVVFLSQSVDWGCTGIIVWRRPSHRDIRKKTRPQEQEFVFKLHVSGLVFERLQWWIKWNGSFWSWGELCLCSKGEWQLTKVFSLMRNHLRKLWLLLGIAEHTQSTFS